MEFLGVLYVGLYIVRKKDISVIWVDKKINDILRTAAIIELAADEGFNDFLDMPADEPVEGEFVEEAPLPGGGEMAEDFDFSARI